MGSNPSSLPTKPNPVPAKRFLWQNYPGGRVNNRSSRDLYGASSRADGKGWDIFRIPSGQSVGGGMTQGIDGRPQTTDVDWITPNPPTRNAQGQWVYDKRTPGLKLSDGEEVTVRDGQSTDNPFRSEKNRGLDRYRGPVPNGGIPKRAGQMNGPNQYSPDGFDLTTPDPNDK